VDNETFTKEVEAQKAKAEGKGKKAQVAKASVQAVKQEEVDLEEAQGKRIIFDKPAKHGEFQNRGKPTGGNLRKLQTAITKRMTDKSDEKKKMMEEVEELDEAKEKKPEYDKNKVVNAVQAAMLKSRGNVIAGRAERAAARLAAKVKHGMKEDVEQIDEISKELAGKYLTAPQGKGANKYKTGEGTSRYPNADTMSKHGTSVKRALQRADTSSLNKKPSYYKEEEQLDELSKGTLGRYIKKAHFAGGMADFRHGMKHDKRGDSKEKTALAKTSHKREKGINKAVDRLTKKD
jgi:hypothetical protein